MSIWGKIIGGTAGFAFGGPIVKDKAFFYVTYEEAEISKPITHGPIGSGLPNDIRITTDEVANIREISSRPRHMNFK